jgi:hypothetical protein
VLSYDLLSELLLRHKSYNHSSSLSELLLIITLTNISSITRTGQTEYIKDEAITVIKALEEVLKAAVTSKAVTVSRKVKATADMIY